MTIQERNDRAALQPDGELTIFEAADFRDALVALSAKHGQLELDLANIERMDSSSVQLVVAACQEMALHITNVSSAVRDQFEIVGCAKFLERPVDPSDCPG